MEEYIADCRVLTSSRSGIDFAFLNAAPNLSLGTHPPCQLLPQRERFIVISSVNRICLKEAKVTKENCSLCGVIRFLVNRVIKGKCIQAIGKSVSVLSVPKTLRAGAVCPAHVGIEGDARKTLGVFHSWATPAVLVTALLTPLDDSVACQGYSGRTSFYSSSYSRASSSRSVHILGSSGKRGEKVASCGFLLMYLELLCHSVTWMSAEIMLSPDIFLSWIGAELFLTDGADCSVLRSSF